MQDPSEPSGKAVVDAQLAYNKWTASYAHSKGMLVGLKNGLDMVDDLVDDYDFAINEECIEYQECDSLKPFVAAGKAILGVACVVVLSCARRRRVRRPGVTFSGSVVHSFVCDCGVCSSVLVLCR
jgi:hypothetical protein